MTKSQLKNIIFECLDEIGIVERGPGDPNSIDGRGPKMKPKVQQISNIKKIKKINVQNKQK